MVADGNDIENLVIDAVSCCVQRRKLWSKAGQVEAVFRAFLESAVAAGLGLTTRLHHTRQKEMARAYRYKDDAL